MSTTRNWGELMQEWFPEADPALVEHAVPLVAAFDTGTAFALSFGIAKFQLAQSQVKLVGEIVGRDGRSPRTRISSGRSRSGRRLILSRTCKPS